MKNLDAKTFKKKKIKKKKFQKSAKAKLSKLEYGLIGSGNIYFTLSISFIRGLKRFRMVLNFPKCPQEKM